MPDKPERLAELEARNAELEAELALYRDAVDHMHQALCVFDPDRRIALFNRRYVDVLNLPEGAIRTGLSARELVELGLAAGHYGTGLTADQLEKGLWANLNAANGERGPLERGGRTYAVQSGRSGAGRLVTTFEDITAQVTAEGAVRESDLRLRAVLDALPDCVKIFAESGDLLHINPKGVELLEAPSLQVLTETGYDPVPEQYMPEIIDVHRRVLAGEPIVWSYEIVGMKGRRRHVEAHSIPFTMPDGSRAHLSITRDINERQEVHEAIRRSEERLRLVHEATGMADFETGADGMLKCSDRFFEQLGLPVTEGPVDSKAWGERIHPDDRQRMVDAIESSLARQDEWFHDEFRIIRADNGEVRWIACSTKIERDENGARIRTIGAHVDITDRKLAEQELRQNEERLRLVQDATGLAEFEASHAGKIWFSDRFAQQAGLPEGTTELTHPEWNDIVHPDDRDQLARSVAESIATRASFGCEFRIIRPDNGAIRWISSRTKVEQDENGEPLRSVGAHLDITERKNAEEAVRESEERFRLAAEAAGLGVWDYDLENDRREWSDRLREIFGIDRETEATLAVAEACIHPDDRPQFMCTLRDARTADVPRFEASFRIQRASDGAERWVTMNGWRTLRSDNQLRRIIMTVRDVTSEKTAEERVRWSASHDALTGLANRSLFNEKLDYAIARASGSGHAVGLLMLDMDHFKQINDSLGHDAGDMLLKMFAKRLRGVVRHCDTVARLGGDEFAVVMPEIDGELALLQVAKAIQERLREPFIHTGRILDSRVSIGATIFPEHGRTPEELMKNADMALYAAKAAGRGMVTKFEPYMRDDVVRRNTMVTLARDAIDDGRIVPYYQPKLDLAGRSLVGFEALLRWRMPNGRIGSPAAIEAAFEDLNVAEQISERMIERVIADMRVWLDRGVQFENVAVNASAAEFRRDNFAERVLDRLRRADIPTQHFELEVTETVFLGRGAEYVHRALALLNMRGVKIALDDFGTGYASLRHLKQFPVDIIKIDQSFVRDMESDPGDEAIIRAVINLGQSLGIRIVAEGIEQDSQAARLLELGCDFGQGFLFARAVHASRVPGLVERWPALESDPETRRSGRDLRLVAARG